MTATLPEQGHPERVHVHLMPHTPLGWWGFGLMLAAAVSPVYWAVLTPLIKQSDPEARFRAALTVAVAVPAVVVGVAALVRRDARSLGLVVAAAVVFVEIAWVVFFVTSFGSGLAGAGIALAAAAAVAAGVLLGARPWPNRESPRR